MSGGGSPDIEYHLRELRADLGCALDALARTEDASESQPRVIRAWIDLESVLEHDIEIHLPALAMLMGVRANEATRADHEPAATADSVPLIRGQLLNAELVIAQQPRMGGEQLSCVIEAFARAHQWTVDARARSGG